MFETLGQMMQIWNTLYKCIFSSFLSTFHLGIFFFIFNIFVSVAYIFSSRRKLSSYLKEEYFFFYR